MRLPFLVTWKKQLRHAETENPEPLVGRSLKTSLTRDSKRFVFLSAAPPQGKWAKDGQRRQQEHKNIWPEFELSKRFSQEFSQQMPRAKRSKEIQKDPKSKSTGKLLCLNLGKQRAHICSRGGRNTALNENKTQDQTQVSKAKSLQAMEGIDCSTLSIVSMH